MYVYLYTHAHTHTYTVKHAAFLLKVKRDQDKEKEVDRTPESLVYVEGVETQALFNFLMNCKSSTASTGPLAGVPPTLLAPVAFHGATLKSLKVLLN